MDPIRQFIDLLDASLLQKIQGISDEHDDRLVILVANEELEHPISVIIVESWRGPHFVVDMKGLFHIPVELGLLEVCLSHDVLDYLVEAFVHLPLVFYRLVWALFLALLVVRVFDDWLDLVDDRQVSAGFWHDGVLYFLHAVF